MSKQILIFNLKDIKHPGAGGAEVVIHELAKRLHKKGHKVLFVTSKYKNSKKEDTIDSINIVRVGSNRYVHTFFAFIYYLVHLRNKFDIIIECTNTAPYMVSLFPGKSKIFLLYHQLARQIWFYETGAPLSWIGYYLLEPVATYIQAFFNKPTITVSESTKNDLLDFGFKKENIKIISEGTKIPPLKSLKNSLPKEEVFTILYLGSLRKMKQPLDVLKAFKILNSKFPNTRLWIAGGGEEFKNLEYYIRRHNLRPVTKLFGRVSEKQKIELMQRAHVFAFTSVKEGWGLTVTESGILGTPSVVYNSDGLRDSCKHMKTGLITKENTPESLAASLELLKTDTKLYKKLRENAFKFNTKITFDKSFQDLRKILNI